MRHSGSEDATNEDLSYREGSPPSESLEATVVPSASEARRDAPFAWWAWRAACGDLVAAGFAAAIATVIRFAFGPDGAIHIPYPLLAVIVAIGWPLLAAACGVYELRTALFGVEELRRVVRTGILLLSGLALAHFMFRLDLSRGYVAILIPLLIVLTAIWRTILRGRMGRRTKRGKGRHRVVAVGPVDELVHLFSQIHRRGASAIRIVAFVADDLDETDAVPTALRQFRRLPSRDAIQRLRTDGVDVDLLVRAGRPQPDELWILARRAYELGAAMAIAPQRHDAVSNMAVSYVPLFETPLLMVETPSMRPAALAGKWIFDRVCALVGLVLLAPLLLIVALVILIRDGRPVLFWQERVGREGRTFKCVKFRTMTRDAEKRRKDLTDQNEVDAPLFKIRNDPRTTRTGRWLRRHSLDEVPQLFHVLTGKMSVVGPRPPLPAEVAEYDERAARRLLVKPGITGLWQVRGRSELPWDEGLYLDLLYVDHWSPILDTMIIARTIREIVAPRGAY